MEVGKNDKSSYYAGLRLDEARNLNWQDIDFNREIIHLKTAKGDKERVIFLHKKLILEKSEIENTLSGF